MVTLKEDISYSYSDIKITQTNKHERSSKASMDIPT